MRKHANARPLIALLTIAAACIISLIAGPALASTAAPAPGTSGLDFGVLTPFTSMIFTGVSAAGIAALAFAAKFLKNKTALVKNEQVRAILDMIASLAYAKVLELFKTSIETLKTASQDGKLTKEEQGAALRTAVREIWNTLPQIARALLTAIAGSEQAAQEEFIKPRVEVAVTHQPPVLKPAQVDYQIGSGRAVEITVGGESIASGRISPLPGGRLPTVQEILEARRRIGLPATDKTAADLANRAAELVRHAN